MALKNAASGTKVIYFDCNDNMYTEDEIKNLKPQQLTKMVVRVPEVERKRVNEIQERQTKQRLQEFLK